jgi:hypothetical protein
MQLLRFATVCDLYEAFPTAKEDVGIEPCDVQSLEFLRTQVNVEAWDEAISYCAFLLPRREAVWWGCQSLRKISPYSTPKDALALDLAESWAQEPDEPRRRAALDYGNQGDKRSPMVWMALAAGWSGGSVVTPEHGNVPAAPHSTARAVRAGLLIARCQVAPAQVPTIFKVCLENGIQLAIGPKKS